MVKFEQSLNRFKSHLSAHATKLFLGGGSSGGGSVNILDNDDVEYTKLSNVQDKSILIFDALEKKKFTVVNIEDVISEIITQVETMYTKLIDVEGTYTYIGEAEPGTTNAAATWRIKRVEEIGNEGDTEIKWADGVSTFNKVWNDRATYSYS